MTDKLRVRVYNVHFGDAVLVTVPDRTSAGNPITRRILIDVGNAPLVASAIGGDDSVFQPVIDDILDQLGGKALDLYVLTHEHLDHAQGLLHADRKLFPAGEFQQKFKVRHVWLTPSAHPDYYDMPGHEKAKKQFTLAAEQYRAISSYLRTTAVELMPSFQSLLANNNPQSTKACVEYIRNLNPKRTHYVHRGVSLTGKHGFRDVKFSIWAPEEDTSEYYGRFQPLGLLEAPAAGATAAEPPSPPAGVDLGAFLNLVESRTLGIADNLLTIDAAANNTSIVFLLEWRGWKLLFAGDAEIRSWKTMNRQGVLSPVHFLKVSHHGSHNGTPEADLFEALLPKKPSDNRKRRAAVSTWTETYGGIPHTPTDNRLKSRAALFSTLDDQTALFFELEFKG
ncbi:MAG: ComEC/Rec2 family competence protein [Acidimicrobiia bacterium]